MTQEFLARLFAELTRVLGPIVADIVMRIFVREAKLDFSEEQLAQLRENRDTALAARADEAERAKG